MKKLILLAFLILCPVLAAQARKIELEPHPRLFLRTEGTDKIPGLEELRRRLGEPYYRATWQKASDPGRYWSSVADQALVFLLTGDSTMIPIVKRRLLDPVDTFGAVINKALAFDWIYNALSENERQNFARRLVDDALLMNSQRSDFTFVFHNYFQARHAAMGLAILAAGDDDSRFDNIFGRVRGAIDETLEFLGDGFPEDDLLGRGGVGGGWPEGYEYDRIASSFFLRLLLAWRSAGLEDYLSGSRYWRDKIFWAMHGTSPDGSYLLGYEDNDYPILLGEDRMRMTFLEGEFRSGYARWYIDNFLETIRGGHYSNRIHPYWDLIFFDATVEPLEPDALPTSRLIPGIGLALMRSSWERDATFVHFNSGGWFTGHQHLAQGSFTVYRGRHLLIEPGVFVGSVDDHYLNWLTRTISHNSITVMDPDEVFVGPGNTVLANDGGQQIQNWIHARPNTVEDWRNQRELREAGRITAFQTHPTHDYLIGESGNAYAPGKVKRWCRQLLFIKPDWIVLCDLVEAGNPQHLKTLFLHTPQEIMINGNRARTPVNGGASMIIYSMLPQGAALETAGGPGKTFEYGGRNWTGPQAINGQFDVAWRLEIKAPLEAATIFLTAIFIPDTVAGARQAPDVALLENTAERVALSLEGGKYVVAFDPAAERSYELSGPGVNFPYPSCDFNADGFANIVDLITLILRGRNNPENPDVDRNGDGRFTIDDAIDLIDSIRSGKCLESSTLLSAWTDFPVPVAEIEGLSAEEIEYLEQMATLLPLSPRQQDQFHQALYGGEQALPKPPGSFALARNTPNPFNPSTVITYSVPAGGPAHVRLEVFDLRGHVVKTLADGIKAEGDYSVFWDGTDNKGRAVSSGIYLYRMRGRDFVKTRKMVLLK